MYSRDLKLIKKFYIVTKLDILTSNYFKHKNIAVIINFKNQPDSSIIRKIVKKNIYNKIFVSNNTKLITNKKIQGIYLSSYNNKIFLANKNHVFNYDVIGGAHNLTDIRKKIQLGCKIIFLSLKRSCIESYFSIILQLSLLICKIMTLPILYSSKNPTFGLNFFGKPG